MAFSPRDVRRNRALSTELSLLPCRLDSATRNRRRELPNVARDAVCWQPLPGGHCIGALILHLADCAAYWIEEVGAGRPMQEEALEPLLSILYKQSLRR